MPTDTFGVPIVSIRMAGVSCALRICRSEATVIGVTDPDEDDPWTDIPSFVVVGEGETGDASGTGSGAGNVGSGIGSDTTGTERVINSVPDSSGETDGGIGTDAPSDDVTGSGMGEGCGVGGGTGAGGGATAGIDGSDVGTAESRSVETLIGTEETGAEFTGDVFAG
ncbi:MAG: hypothetical protein Q4C47_03565, partial [Planctomycetia bacterium]|nr:hypothetical protein [Planctomycetia bacterium]